MQALDHIAAGRLAHAAATDIVPACQPDGACTNGLCVTNGNGTGDICNGSDPGSPGVPRTDQCALP